MQNRDVQKAKLYDLESITGKMKREFGSIARGDENKLFMQLFVIEEVLLKAYLRNPKTNSRRAKEAINVCLLRTKGYLNNKEYDFSGMLDQASLEIADKLSMTFIPFENKELYEVLKENFDLNSMDFLKRYFKEPIQCLIRIYASVEFWEKASGPQGYFEFLKEHILSQIDVESDKVNYAVSFT